LLQECDCPGLGIDRKVVRRELRGKAYSSRTSRHETAVSATGRGSPLAIKAAQYGCNGQPRFALQTRQRTRRLTAALKADLSRRLTAGLSHGLNAGLSLQPEDGLVAVLTAAPNSEDATRDPWGAGWPVNRFSTVD